MTTRLAPLVLATLCVTAGCAPASAWRATSPDHLTRMSVTPTRTGGACVVVDHEPRRCHDAVNLATVAFAARARATAYAARSGNGWAIVRDGRAGPAWVGVGVPVLSEDGAHLAYPATDGEGWRMIHDDAAGPRHDAIVEGSLAFASDGRLAYAAVDGDSVRVIVAGRPGRGWAGVARVRLLGSAQHATYLARATLTGAMRTLVVDERARVVEGEVGEVAWNERASTIAWTERAPGGWYVNDGLSRHGPFDEVRRLRFPDPGSAAPSFVARTRGRSALFIAGAPLQWHERLTDPVFDATGHHWAYIADDSAVHVDGRLAHVIPSASEVAISGDGARHAVLALAEDGASIVAGDQRYRFDVVIAASLQYLPGEAVWACLAGDRTRRELFVVLDGRATTRRLDWRELVRIAERGGGNDELRAWVAAEGRLALDARP